MKVLITGANGQLGRAVAKYTPPNVILHALPRSRLDIAYQQAVFGTVAELRPDAIINCAAYTNVDDAESRPDYAKLVNAHGPAYLAEAAHAYKAKLIHISTDYVFDGTKGFYTPDDPVSPINVYGQTKALGEQYVMEETKGNALILRTSWLYSAYGKNFVTSMLKRMQEQPEVRVVRDQIGSPTWAEPLGYHLWHMLKNFHSGIYHYTDEGAVSRHVFAEAISAYASHDYGILTSPVNVQSIASSEMPTPAKRPPHCLLEYAKTQQDFGIYAYYWRDNLKQMLKELAETAYKPI